MLRKAARYLERRITSSNDDRKTRLHKRTALIMGFFLCTAFPPYTLYFVFFDPPYLIYMIGITTLACIPATLSMVYLLATRRLPWKGVEFSMLCFSASILWSDLVQGGKSGTFFALVLVMDALLLADCKPGISKGLSVVGSLYITLFTIEQMTDFGLYDVLPGAFDRPRKLSFFNGINSLVNKLLVFLIDFGMTRYCAMTMYREQSKMADVIVLAEAMADAMSRYDLDEASLLVEQAEDKRESDKLCTAFNRLLENLEEYKQYLPHSVIAGPALLTGSDPPGKKRSTHSTLSLICQEQQQYDEREGKNLKHSRHVARTLRKQKQGRTSRKEARFVQGFEQKHIAVAEVRLLHDDELLEKASRGYLERVGQIFLTILFESAESTPGLVINFNSLSATVVFGVSKQCSQARTIQSTQDFSEDMVSRMEPHLDLLNQGGFQLGIGVADGKGIVGYLGTRDHSSFNVLGPVPRKAAGSIKIIEAPGNPLQFRPSITHQVRPDVGDEDGCQAGASTDHPDEEQASSPPAAPDSIP